MSTTHRHCPSDSRRQTVIPRPGSVVGSSVGPRHGHLVRASHVGQLAVRRKGDFLRLPANLEARDLQAVGDEAAKRRLAFQRRLPRGHDERIVAPIRNDLLDVLPRRGGRPLGVPLQQLRLLRPGVERRPRTAPGEKKECCDDEDSDVTMHGNLLRTRTQRAFIHGRGLWRESGSLRITTSSSFSAARAPSAIWSDWLFAMK